MGLSILKFQSDFLVREIYLLYLFILSEISSDAYRSVRFLLKITVQFRSVVTSRLILSLTLFASSRLHIKEQFRALLLIYLFFRCSILKFLPRKNLCSASLTSISDHNVSEARVITRYTCYPII